MMKFISVKALVVGNSLFNTMAENSIKILLKRLILINISKTPPNVMYVVVEMAKNWLIPSHKKTPAVTRRSERLEYFNDWNILTKVIYCSII